MADSKTSTPQAPVPTGVTYPQDYTLKTITLLSQFGTYDLKNSFVELSYYEDIFSSCISGVLVITEAEGLIERFNMVGNEYLRLVFSKASDKTYAIDKLFRVYKVSNRQLVGTMQSEGYVIHFCSDELLLSEQYKVSKSYKGRGISSIVTDILQNYLKVPPKKKLNIEPTKGVYDFIVPNFKPFEAINWLSTYALSASTGVVGADMIFFENKFGFNFASLQTLFQQPIYKTYNYKPKSFQNANETTDDKFYAVISYQHTDSFDTLQGISTGVFANQLITIDPLLQTHYTTNFNYNKYFDSSKKLNSHPIINGVKNRFDHALYETTQAVVKVATTNTNQKNVPYLASRPGSFSKDIFIEQYVPNRTAQLSLSNYHKITMKINGDPGASAGLTIQFDLLSMNPSTNKKEKDRFNSGKYLISAVKHSIDVAGYTSVLEIVKDSTPKEYATPNMDQTIWKNTVKGIT
jgi:hypothetical protein